MSRTVPPCTNALHWLKERGWDLAPLTGQDVAALSAIAHCWQMWTHSDADGQRAAIRAVAALLLGCQEVCWPMARELIAHAGDWGHRGQVWPKVVLQFQTLVPLHDRAGDIERVWRLARCHEGLAQVQQ